jgi:LuxR family transcriptional regulator, maltose regulon positive regulatory protein
MPVLGKRHWSANGLLASGLPAAWLSLDEGDNDPIRFLTYLVAALQTLALSEAAEIVPQMGAGVLAALQSPQPPSIESILTSLLNDISAIPVSFILVLDDYHMIESSAVDQALAFLVEHQPAQMHLVSPRVKTRLCRWQGCALALNWLKCAPLICGLRLLKLPSF